MSMVSPFLRVLQFPLDALLHQKSFHWLQVQELMTTLKDACWV